MTNRASLSAEFGDAKDAVNLLKIWRHGGLSKALLALNEVRSTNPLASKSPFIRELTLRLSGEPGPRLLVDGLWLCRAKGGITRVWEQIFSFWQLPGMFSSAAPVLLIDRGSHLLKSLELHCHKGTVIDPLDLNAVKGLENENVAIAKQWGADVFLSSWISTCGSRENVCHELALVHDCMPERSRPDEMLLQLRRRWLLGASAHMAVSQATAQDLEGLFCKPAGTIPWCHSAPGVSLDDSCSEAAASEMWSRLFQRMGLKTPFVLLPATSCLGSYKNPELVADALDHPSMKAVQMVICGIAADQHRSELEDRFPSLIGRINAAGFTDQELSLVYRHALAVVIPSRIEGFGLPVIEALASGGNVLVADSRGLREAGGEAAMRFHPDHPVRLRSLLELFLHDQSREAFESVLNRRRQQRLQRLNPDFLGLSLLVLARQLSR